MATPQSTTSSEGSGPKKLEQITFRFCSECSNMLYPKEDEDAHKLQFTCRTCQFTEEAQSTCVFRNELNNSAGETAGVTQDVGSDPTVSGAAAVFCLGCGCLIYCDTCGNVAADLAATTGREERYDVGGKSFRQITFSWSDFDDPFAEYDEELMDQNDGKSGSSTMDDSYSDASAENGFATNGQLSSPLCGRV